MKRPKLSKRRAFWGVNLLLAVCTLLCLLGGRGVRAALPTLNAAETWAGESGEPFAQLACYLPSDQKIEEEQVLQFRRTLEEKFTEAAMEAPENGSLYTDAYSGEGSLTVTGERGSAQVKVIGVGGDFFRFHPLKLRSGNYLSESDLMQDRVLLDEELAWQLFGGMDLAGMTVTIQEKSFYVAGVVSREDDRYSAMAYTGGAGMFFSYAGLKSCLPDTAISCYEIVLPNPISSFGRNMVEESFPMGDGILLENSSRYSLSNLWRVIRDFGKRSMGLNGIIYPYWENAVRVTEDYAALLLLLTVLFGVMPAVSAILFAVHWAARGWKAGKHLVKTKVSAGLEQRREKKWQAAAEKTDPAAKEE